MASARMTSRRPDEQQQPLSTRSEASNPQQVYIMNKYNLQMQNPLKVSLD